MDTIGDRIKAIRGEVTQVKFAELMNVPVSTLSNYELNKSEPSFVFLKKLIEKYAYPLEWIIFGDNKVENGIKNLKNAISTEFTTIPIVEACLSAGSGSLNTSDNTLDVRAFKTEWLTKKGNPASMVLMHVSGDSMYPEVYDKDIVLIDQSKKQILASQMYAVGIEEAIYIKRIETLPNKIILKSSNKEYDPIIFDINEFNADQFRIIGRILWVGREY